MVIQCAACDTRFKLADDKIKSGGVKVRCSKCKEVFTVMPPEEEATEDTPDFSTEEESTESAGSDWSDLDSDNDDSGESEEAGGIDWSNMGGDDESTDESENDDAGDGGFSFGDDDSSSDTDSIAFDDDSSGGSDEFSVDESDGPSEEDFGFDEQVGEGANDEFSFDDGAGSSLDVSDDAAPDFDWDGSSDDTDSSDNLDLAGDEGDGDLDFSSVDLEEKEEPPPSPEAAPSSLVIEDTDKPLSAKGPQRGTGSKRGRKQKKQKKGPMRGILFFFLFILILAGGHAGILYWKGFWKGDPAEFTSMDHQTVHLQVYKELYAEITGGKVVRAPVGQISVLGMSGRFVENNSAGTVFVIEGKIKNEFKETRSAIAVRGVLYNQSGKPTMRKKVYCGNKLSEVELQTLSLDKIQERLDNQFGDSLSNLDVSPGVVLPYTIVFGKLPDNLAEFNVEVAESAPGSNE